MLRDGGRLPDGWLEPICSPVRALLDVGADRTASDHEPEPVLVAPGSLGAWADDDDLASGSERA